MPSWLTLKLGGMILCGLAALSFVMLALHWKHQAADRGEKLATICQVTRAASGVPKLKCGEVAAQIQFLGEALNAVREKTAKAKADDAAHAKEVESRQTTIGQESSRDYQAELARVRADYAERLRRAASAANPSGRGNAPVSRLTSSASGPDAAAAQNGFPPEDALIATEQALQLEALQNWARKEGLAK